MILSNGSSGGTNKKNVIFHDLAANLCFKIKPFDFKLSPYAIMGLRYDYMIAYKDIVFEEQASGLKLNMYKSQIEDFSKSNLGGLMGIGVEYNTFLYFELEFNPSISKSYSTSFLDIKDNCWVVKMGMNL